MDTTAWTLLFLVALGVAFFGTLGWVLWTIVRETRDAPLARMGWVLLVLFVPLVGMLVWAWARTSLPDYTAIGSTL